MYSVCGIVDFLEFSDQGRPDDVAKLTAGHSGFVIVSHRTAVRQSSEEKTLRTKSESRVADNVLKHHRPLGISTNPVVLVSVRR